MECTCKSVYINELSPSSCALNDCISIKQLKS